MKKRFFLIPVSLLAIATCGVAVISCNKPGTYGISAESKLTGTSIEVDKTTLGDSDSVTITMTNTRSATIVDANLSIIIGSNHTNVALDGGLTTEGLTLTYTKQQIQEKISWYKIKDKDQIKFLLGRSGACEVKQEVISEKTVYRLYQFDDFGESNLVPDNKLSNFEQRLLTKNQYNEFILSDKKQYSSLIMNLSDDATFYLIYGNYHHSSQTGPTNPIRLTIHGVCNSAGTSYADIQGYDPDYEADEDMIHYANVELNLNNVNVLGRPSNSDYHWVHDRTNGIAATPKPSGTAEENNIEVTANYCNFSGAYCLWSNHSVYNNCTFDSTNTLKKSGSGYKNNYPMYIYSGSSAEFHNCTFNSLGKAVKIFTDGQGLGSVLTTNTFDKCIFNLLDSEKTIVEYEFPINIESTNYTVTGVDVNITGCSMNQKWEQAKGNVYGVVDSYTGGYYDHIKINGQKVPVPAQI